MDILNNVFLSEKEIQTHVKKLAKDIVRYYREKRSERIVIIMIWNGAFMFGNDLIKQINKIKNQCVELITTGITIKRYGDQLNGKKEIYIEPIALSEIKEKYKGLPKLVVDEIIDEGKTIEALNNAIGDFDHTENCALFVKNNKLEINTPIRFTGLEVENKFYVGYGMGHGDRFRNLPYIGIINQ